MRLAPYGVWLLLLALPGRTDEPVRVIIASVAAATNDAAHNPDGLSTPIGRVARALMARIGYRPHVELLPFARAVNETETHANIVLLPLARTPAREANYKWLVPLFDDDCVMITYPGRGAGKGRAIDPTIGVVRASATEEVAGLLGLSNVELSVDDIQNARKLAAGRIDGWFAVRRRAATAIQAAGMDPKNFQISAPLRHFTFYIAGSLNLGADEAARWTAAGETMRSDEVLTSLLSGGVD